MIADQTKITAAGVINCVPVSKANLIIHYSQNYLSTAGTPIFNFLHVFHVTGLLTSVAPGDIMQRIVFTQRLSCIKIMNKRQHYLNGHE